MTHSPTALVQRHSPAEIAAVRAARSAAAIPAEQAAAAAGVTTEQLVHTLGALDQRGGCADTAAVVSAYNRADVYISRRLRSVWTPSPPLMRAAPLDPLWSRLAALQAGSAAWWWAERTGLRGTHRRCLIGQAQTDRRRFYAASNAACPPAMLRHLAFGQYPDARAATAAHSRCPADTLVLLTSDSAPEVRARVAANPATSEMWLHKLAEDSHSLVRAGTAANPATPSSLLDKIVAQTRVGNHDTPIRDAAANNPHTSQRALRILATDPTPDIRAAVAAHPNISPDMIETFARYGDKDQRRGVAANPTPPPRRWSG